MAEYPYDEDVYVHQDYPKWLFHEDGRKLIVQDYQEELEMGQGWGYSPVGPFDLNRHQAAPQEAEVAEEERPSFSAPIGRVKRSSQAKRSE